MLGHINEKAICRVRIERYVAHTDSLTGTQVRIEQSDATQLIWWLRNEYIPNYAMAWFSSEYTTRDGCALAAH